MTNDDKHIEYRITERCIACGTCLAVCPAGCIAGGAPPFIIRQSYCVRCGKCYEKCPVRAILQLTRLT